MDIDSAGQLRIGLLLGFLTGGSGLVLASAPIVLPELGRSLGTRTGGTAWVLAAASLSVGVITPVLGRLGDLRGLRTVLAIGMTCMVAGAAGVMTAPSFALLIVARLVQGAGAAGVSMTAFATASALLTGAARARVLGLMTAMSAIALGCGPLLGAAMSSALGWRWALALPVVVLLAWPWVARLAPVPDPDAGRLDVRGAILVVAAAASLTALLQARATRLPAAAVACALVGGATAGGLAAAHVRRETDGFLPAALLGSRRFRLLSGAAALLFCGYLGMTFAAPVMLRADTDWSELHVGAVLLPAALAAALAARIAGAVSARLPAGAILIAVAPVSAGALLLAALVPHEPAAVVAGSAGAICGFAVAQVAVLDAIPAAVPAAVRGVAVGVFNFVFITGGTLGAAAAGGMTDIASPAAAVGLLAVAPLVALPLSRAAERVPA